MDLSHFLAKVMGSYMLIMSALWLLRKDKFGPTVRSVMDTPGTFSLTAIIQIVFGLMIVISHSVWTLDWKVLITLIGYFAIIQGILRLAFPEETKDYLMDAAQRGYWFLMGFLVVVGGILAYHGFAG